MNGATEATLAELVRIAQAQNANLERLNTLLSGRSSGGGGGGGNAMADMARSIPLVNVAFDILGGVAKIVGGAFEILGNVVGKVIGGFFDTIDGLKNFTQKAMEGTARLSDLYAAFGKLPFFLGEVASGLSFLLKVVERLADEYKVLTNAGATFGGDIMGLRNTAQSLGIGFDKLSGLITSNSEILASWGDGVTGGAKKFVKAVETLMGPDSKYSQSIYALGMGTAEAAEYTLTMMKLNQTMAKDGKNNTAALADATGKYILELDLLAKTTGIHRDQLNAQLKEVGDDQVFQTFMDGLTYAQRTNVNKMYAVISSELGRDAADKWFKNIARGVDAPLNEFSDKLSLNTNGMSTQVGKSIRKLIDETDPKKLTMGLYQQMDILGKANGEFRKQLGTTGQAIAGDLILSPVTKWSRKVEAYGGNVEKMLAAQQEEQARQREAAVEAAKLQKAQENITKFGNMMTILLGRLAEQMLPHLTTWGEKLITWMISMAQEYGPKLSGWFAQAIKLFDEYVLPKLEKIGTWFKETWDSLVSAKTPQQFFERLGERFKNGMQNVWDDLKTLWQFTKPAFLKIWNDDIRPALVSALKTAGDFLVDSMRKSSWFARLILNKTDNEIAEDEKKELADLRKQKRMLTNQADMDPTVLAAAGDMGMAMSAQAEAQQKLARLRELELKYSQNGSMSPEQFRTSVHGRAIGGPVSPGTYLVGEKGPEILDINGNGQVFSNDNLSTLLNKMANNTDNKNLLVALEALNNNMRQLNSYARETAESTRRTVNEVAGLSGNLIPTI
jgi:hypothetical protein